MSESCGAGRRAGGGDRSNGDARCWQTTSASVQGTVVDAQKGLLPGVTVTLKSKTQSEVLTAVTDGEGRFVFPIVRPDTYVLSGGARRVSRPSSRPTWS